MTGPRADIRTPAAGGVVMCGCTGTGVHVARYLLEHGVRIAQFVTLSPEKAAQMRVSGYTPFDGVAAEFGVPLRTVKKYSMNDEEDIAFFRERRFDILIQGGWQRLFPGEVLASLRVGGIGVHGSSEFLPKGRGRSPINWSIIEGKRRFILQFFIMNPSADAGPVFHSEMFDINEWDTCNTLYMKIAVVTKRVLLSRLPSLLAGDYTLAPQAGEPSWYPARTPEDGRIDWSGTLWDIHNFVRALAHPYPGAFTFAQGRRVNIWGAQPFDTRITFPGAAAGEVVEIFDGGEFVVNCNSGLLLVTSSEGTVRPGVVLGS